mmetsp:Transcript_23269/g.48317  ORF Transcript_23269/g.48317 Transcript_23269/m.48317 type:complete len:224 (-) Transcript_23269:35-706(-)
MISIITLATFYCFFFITTSALHPCNNVQPLVKAKDASRRSLALSIVASLPVPAFAVTTLPEEYRQGTLGAGNADMSEPVPYEKYKKMDNGIVYADQAVRASRADASKVVAEGSKVNVQWLLRKANGYFVDSSEVQGGVPFIFTVGDGTAIDCVDQGVRGMSQGGSRRIVCPLNLGYVKGVEDNKPGPLPKGFGPRQQIRRVQEVRKDVPGEYLFFEVAVTRVQ